MTFYEISNLNIETLQRFKHYKTNTLELSSMHYGTSPMIHYIMILMCVRVIR